MSLNYQAVGWNPQKKTYDLTILAGVVIYVGAFVGLGLSLRPEITAETLLIRALGTAALIACCGGILWLWIKPGDGLGAGG